MARRPPTTQLWEGGLCSRRDCRADADLSMPDSCLCSSGFLPMVTADLENVKIEKEKQSQHWMEKVTENHREMHHM